MAKIVMEFEDQGDKVKFTCTPNFEQIAKMENAGTELTSAHGIVLFLQNCLLDYQRKTRNTEEHRIYIPKVRGSSL